MNVCIVQILTAVGLNMGVPWVMCKEDDAPDPVVIINAWNGFYCDAFSHNKPYPPSLWVEARSGWKVLSLPTFANDRKVNMRFFRFTEFGGTIHRCPVQDLAFAGTSNEFKVMANDQYTYDSTMEEPTMDGPFITTSYDYDAAIDEYDEKTEVIATNLSHFLFFLRSHRSKLLAPRLGLIRGPKHGLLKELCRAIKLCEHALVPSDPTVTSLGTYQQVGFLCPDYSNYLLTYNEDISSLGESSRITVPGLLEHLNVASYLWYTTSVDISLLESFPRGGQKSTLDVNSVGHALHVFINGHCRVAGLLLLPMLIWMQILATNVQLVRTIPSSMGPFGSAANIATELDLSQPKL
ncbi:hypothetical protein Gotur_002836 [Gossypium turneri]